MNESKDSKILRMIGRAIVTFMVIFSVVAFAYVWITIMMGG